MAYTADQSSFTAMSRVVRQERARAVNGTDGIFDVIIDDGSHACDHIVASLEILFLQLKPGGIYVIEDLNLASPCVTDLMKSFMVVRSIATRA